MLSILLNITLFSFCILFLPIWRYDFIIPLEMISSSFLQEFRVFSYVSYNYHASLLHLSSFSPGGLKGRSGGINVPGSISFSVVLQLPAPLGFCVHDVVPQKQAICAGFCDLPQHCWMETRAEFKSFP